MKRVIATICLAALTFGQSPLIACVNTSYSEEFEEQLTSEVVKLVMGQFAHHGPAFYEQELKRTDKLLAAEPADFEARNDRAAALLKLERYSEARTAFEENDKQFPDRYKTHANLGVLFKKTGEYKRAAKHIAKSLEIKPEGHLNLGNYYLLMLEWLANNETGTPEASFLGASYTAGPLGTAGAGAKEDYLVSLIRNAPEFADAYLLLGDLHVLKNDHAADQIAVRCYVRAEQLYPDAVKPLAEERLHLVNDNLKFTAMENPRFTRASYRKEMREETASAAAWLAAYKNTEAELIGRGKAADVGRVKALMEINGIEEPTYNPVGFESWSDRGARILIWWVAVPAWILVLIAIGWRIRKLRRDKAPEPPAAAGEATA